MRNGAMSMGNIYKYARDGLPRVLRTLAMTCIKPGMTHGKEIPTLVAMRTKQQVVKCCPPAGVYPGPRSGAGMTREIARTTKMDGNRYF